jgi:hypothetical protein
MTWLASAEPRRSCPGAAATLSVTLGINPIRVVSRE